MATAPAPTLRPHFDLYGVHVRREFSSPTACPWLRYNYVCTNRPEYRSWLEAWATHASPVVPPSTPLPQGTSIWFGMSHLYQYAAALMCQHRDELESLKMWQCDSVRHACMSKTEAYTEQSQECVGSALSEERCKLVPVSKDSRCAPDAWVNVYGANGTRAAKLDVIPILPATPEDGSCGVGGLSWPSCSMSIQRFSFRGGHCAIIVHNHPAQFIQDGLAKLIHSLGIRMRKVATIVYSSPWFLHQAYRRKMCTCQGAPHTCLRMSEASIFHRKHFNQVRCICPEDGWAQTRNYLVPQILPFAQSILQFALASGFKGNLVLTSRMHGLINTERNATLEFVSCCSPEISRSHVHVTKSRPVRAWQLASARQAGITASFVDPSEVAMRTVNGQLCSNENQQRPCSRNGGHQCMPSVPDIVAWEIQKHLFAGTAQQ